MVLEEKEEDEGLTIKKIIFPHLNLTRISSCTTTTTCGRCHETLAPPPDEVFSTDVYNF